jgi:dethiobiotin synthetase
MNGLFITGIDTGVGKTLVGCALLRALAARNERVAGLKPLSAGSEDTPEGPRHADALALQAAANVELPYERVNPVVLAPPIAPHIAAAEAGIELRVADLAGKVLAPAIEADRVLVEGVGGWMVPLSTAETTEDLARVLGFPVILVVALRLGCLNHALLTADRVRRAGLPLAAWVATEPDPDSGPDFGSDSGGARRDENFETLEIMLGAPCLGRIPHLEPPDPVAAARYLDVSGL